MKQKRFTRPMALVLTAVLLVGMFPTAALATQQNSYHDPAGHWQQSVGHTNELDVNSTITHETFNCGECHKQTSFLAFRVPEYTRDGQTSMTRNVK